MATRDVGAVTSAKDKWRVREEVRLIAKFIKDEDSLQVWKGRGASVRSLRDVLGRWNSWTAADCSDLIRLYCTVMESKYEGHYPLREGSNPLVGKEVAEAQASARPGGAKIWGAGADVSLISRRRV